MNRALRYGNLALILVVAHGLASAENPRSFGTDVSIIVSVQLTVQPQVKVTASDPWASEPQTDAGQFLLERVDSMPSTITAHFTIHGTATYGTDYSLSSDPPVELAILGDGTIEGTVELSEGASFPLNVIPLDDSEVEGWETVALTLSPDPSYGIAFSGSATVIVLDDEWTYNPDTGNDYRLSSPGTWIEVEDEATSLGGHLVAVSDDPENQWLLETFGAADIGVDALWIGLTDAAEEGVWIWSNGEPVAYTNWREGAPAGAYDENYAAMYTNVVREAQGQWDDYASDVVYPGIMERPPTPPEIVTHPVSLKVNPGDRAEFSVEATGTQPFSYQWRQDGADIPGATSSTLVIESAQAGDAGNYDCVVINVVGSVISTPASLAINRAPSANPDSYTVQQGGTLNVSAPGVLVNDSDPDGDALTAQLINGPSHAGQFVLNPNGAFTYVHNGASATPDSFTYRASDGSLVSAPTAVGITIAPVTGSLRVTILPAEAVAAGAQWRVDGGPWQVSGATVSGLAPGGHLISFKDMSALGWAKPADRAVTIVAGDVATVTGTYTRIPLSPPANVQASDGTYPDKVGVTWDAAPHAAQYQVYRAETNDFGAAQLLGATTETVYWDFTAAEPDVTRSGCPAQTTYSYHYYWYWVVATHGAGASEPGGPDQGYRGASDKKSLDTVFEPVLPRKTLDGPGFAMTSTRLAAPQSPLAIRLRSEEGIDPTTVWGVVAVGDFVGEDVFWLPIDHPAGARESEAPAESSLYNTASGLGQDAQATHGHGMVSSDGWMVYWPETAWPVGDTIVMTVGARTLSGAELGPITYQFLVPDPEAAAERGEGEVRRGGPAEPTGRTQETLLWVQEGGASAALPGLAQALGPVYEIGPDQLYAEPQRLWLPLPPGVRADGVQLYYCHGEGDEAGWYPGENVEGWLVPESFIETHVGGVTYLGFEVRHGGTVQFAPVENAVTAPTAMLSLSGAIGGNVGDLFCFALVMTAPLLARWNKRRKAEKQSSTRPN